MKIGFRIFLILTLLFSFVVGMPKPAIETEASFAIGITNGATDALHSLLIFLLLVSHVMLLFLLFMRQTVHYRYFLIYFPIVFWLLYVANTYADHLEQPDMFLSHFPYLLCYILCVIQYYSVLKADPSFALGLLLPEEEPEGLPRQRFDTNEPM